MPNLKNPNLLTLIWPAFKAFFEYLCLRTACFTAHGGKFLFEKNHKSQHLYSLENINTLDFFSLERLSADLKYKMI